MAEVPYIRAEIASTPASREVGLMGRKNLSENSGMLFDFHYERPLSFWMKNTYIPLQIAFINSDGKIIQIESMAPLSTKMVCSKSKCRYALEVNDGWFEKNKVSVGGKILPQSGSWPEDNRSGVFAFGQVIVPTSPLIPPSGGMSQGNGSENGQQAEQQGSSIQLLDSWKDIFKKADELDIPLVIEWQTKDGYKMPRTQISPPYELSKTKDGDHDGLLVAWSDREAHFISPIIDNIVGVFDVNGVPVNSIKQIEQIRVLEVNPTQPEPQANSAQENNQNAENYKNQPLEK